MDHDERSPSRPRRAAVGGLTAVLLLAMLATGCGRARSAASGPATSTTAESTADAPPSTSVSTTSAPGGSPTTSVATAPTTATSADLDTELDGLDHQLSQIDHDADQAGQAIDHPQEDQ